MLELELGLVPTTRVLAVLVLRLEPTVALLWRLEVRDVPTLCLPVLVGREDTLGPVDTLLV